MTADPFTVATFIRERFAQLKDYLFKQQPLGEIEHIAVRAEPQNRGSTHFHVLLWIKGAPSFPDQYGVGGSSNEEITAFIDKHVTNEMPDEQAAPVLRKKVLAYQVHK